MDVHGDKVGEEEETESGHEGVDDDGVDRARAENGERYHGAVAEVALPEERGDRSEACYDEGLWGNMESISRLDEGDEEEDSRR